MKNFALLGFLYIGVSVVLLAVGLILDAAIVVHSEGLIVLAVLGLLQLYQLEVFTGLEPNCDELAGGEALSLGEARELKVVASS